MIYPTEVQEIGELKAEGKQVKFNVIKVRQGYKETVYSKQEGKWLKPCNRHGYVV